MNKPDENKIIRVALYIRVSTEEQAKHGYSLHSQETRLKEYSKQHNYKIINIYRDEGKSARSKLNQRTSLLQLIEDVKNHEFDRIIFWRLDRWFRNIADYYRVQEILDKNKVDWECTDEEYNTTSSNGRLHLNIKLSIAQNESDQTSDRIKFNFENMVNEKKAIFGNSSCPFGYKVEGEKKNKHVVKDKDKEEIVNFIFDNYMINNNCRKTTLMANEKFNVTLSARTVANMLKKTIYYGEYKDVPDYTEPYISKDEWDRIQELLPKSVRQNRNHDYIFSGLLICKCCGTRMSATTTRGMQGYRCHKYRDNRSCKNAKYISEKKLEKYLIENLNNIKQTEINLDAKERNNYKQLDVEKNIKKVNSKIERLNELYIDGNISKEKYNNDLNKYKEEKEKLNSQRNQNKKKKAIINMPDNINELYKTLNAENKRAFWNKYFQTIIFDPEPNNFEDRISLMLR